MHADVPVRMALGETHVIALTKRALGDSGVNVDALETAAAASGKAAGQTRVERSGSVLLVKNLPYTASEPELQVLLTQLVSSYKRCCTSEPPRTLPWDAFKANML